MTNCNAPDPVERVKIYAVSIEDALEPIEQRELFECPVCSGNFSIPTGQKPKECPLCQTVYV